MSIASVKKAVRTAQQQTSPLGKKVSKSEAQAIVAEARKGRVTAGERKVVKHLMEHGDLAPAAKTVLSDFLGQGPAGLNLGVLDPPGATLRGKQYALAPGQSMTWETYGNQLANASFSSTDAEVKTEVLNHLQAFGEKLHYRHTLTVPKTAAAGSVLTVQATPAYQVRFDPDWAFGFSIKVS